MLSLPPVDRSVIGENASAKWRWAASGSEEKEVFSMRYPSIFTNIQELTYMAESLPRDRLGKGKFLKIQWKEKIKSKLVGSYSIEKNFFFLLIVNVLGVLQGRSGEMDGLIGNEIEGK